MSFRRTWNLVSHWPFRLIEAADEKAGTRVRAVTSKRNVRRNNRDATNRVVPPVGSGIISDALLVFGGKLYTAPVPPG